MPCFRLQGPVGIANLPEIYPDYTIEIAQLFLNVLQKRYPRLPNKSFSFGMMMEVFGNSARSLADSMKMTPRQKMQVLGLVKTDRRLYRTLRNSWNDWVPFYMTYWGYQLSDLMRDQAQRQARGRD